MKNINFDSETKEYVGDVLVATVRTRIFESYKDASRFIEVFVEHNGLPFKLESPHSGVYLVHYTVSED